MVPGSPIGVWFHLRKITNSVPATWDEFKAAVLKEFAPAVDATRRAEILGSFKQKPKERVGDFLNRISVGYTEFLGGMDIRRARGTDAGTQAAVDAAMSTNKAYHLSSFFRTGLREPMLTDVTKIGVSDLEGMVEVAKRSEQAANQHKGAVGGVSQEPKDLQEMVNNLVDKAIAARDAAAAQAGSQGQAGVAATNNGGGKKNKTRPLSDVICFFCFVKGHYSNDCTKRKDERNEGKWRPTVKDQIMTKEQYDKLSQAEKNKGKAIALGKSSSAAVQAGVTYAQVSNPSSDVNDEEAWNRYYSNPN